MSGEGARCAPDGEASDAVRTQDACSASASSEFLPKHSGFSTAERVLLVVFLLTLPFVTPRVRWDGIGYYAYARSVIVDHNLQFKGDWRDPRAEPFLFERDGRGVIHYLRVTKTGHIPNVYAVGPGILWAPLIATVHGAILTLDYLGCAIPHDGHGKPYLYAMALASALYAFLGLWLSFRTARDFVAEKWAFLATLAIWFASSLPVYMYSDPSWSHADSVFAVGLFIWYWHRTRDGRTAGKWILWGLISGLMCDVYLANGALLLLAAFDLLSEGRQQRAGRKFSPERVRSVLRSGMAYAAAFLAAFSPTLIVRQIIFGNPLAIGFYSSRPWNWASPKIWNVLASPSHGLVTTTPVLALAFLGVGLLWWRDRKAGGALLLATSAFYLLIAVDPWWDGTISFGNRFFVSLTPIFIVGLAVALESSTWIWRDSAAAVRRAAVVLAILIVWNLGLVYQLDRQMFPVVGHVDWGPVVYNQFRTVPGEVFHSIQAKVAPERWDGESFRKS